MAQREILYPLLSTIETRMLDKNRKKDEIPSFHLFSTHTFKGKVREIEETLVAPECTANENR